MTDYFYTDPLAAAWMNKHFGMTFGFRYESGEFNWNPGYGVLARWRDIKDWNEYAGPVFIHPDSLHLLEPRKGDKVSYSYGVGPHAGETWDEVIGIVTNDDEGYPYTGNGEPYVLVDECNEFPLSRLKEIFQRNGKPFFWPESEAA